MINGTKQQTKVFVRYLILICCCSTNNPTCKPVHQPLFQ